MEEIQSEKRQSRDRQLLWMIERSQVIAEPLLWRRRLLLLSGPEQTTRRLSLYSRF